jgi:hypothetical protein
MFLRPPNRVEGAFQLRKHPGGSGQQRNNPNNTRNYAFGRTLRPGNHVLNSGGALAALVCLEQARRQDDGVCILIALLC